MFKVGQRVRVTKIVDREWIAPDVLEFIGQIGEVTDDFGGSPITVEFPNGDGRWFLRGELEEVRE